MSEDLAQAALDYAARGIAVFPLVPRQKRPLVANGFKEASRDPDQVRRWWGRNAQSNVGIATGVLAGFWVLDLDGPEAEADLAALEAVHGALPVTVEQATGKGRHLCFAWDPARPVRNSQGKIGRGIDVRGEGGYIVAPPSIHPGDEKKGIPAGRVYTWSPGRSPADLAFAPAPPWLLALALPAAEQPRPASATSLPRKVEQGRASRFGEATLATVCRLIATAPPGKQQGSLWGYACQVGAYVAGGEIEADYARRALIDAGLRMTPAGKPWLQKDVESHVDRGLAKGALHPKSAPERRAFEPAQRAPRKTEGSPTAAEAAIDIRDVRQLWESARPGDCGLARSWLKIRGLDPQGLPGALGAMRAHQRAPLAPNGVTGPALLIPLSLSVDDLAWGGPPDGVMTVPLMEHGPERGVFLGAWKGRVAMLTPWPADGALLIAMELQDAWALGQNACESGHELGVIVAPHYSSFAGGALGDKFGRVDPRTPYADPEAAPWTTPGERAVFLAVRGDLQARLKSRKTFGGTDRAQLEGEAAARFYAGLAEQAWRRAGANAVRILRPSAGVGFNSGRRGKGA